MSTVMRESTSDVIPAAGDIIYSIEAKSGAGFSLDSIFASPLTCLFSKWWAQTNWDARVLTEATGIQRYPLLFLKPHVNTDWVAVATETFNGILKPKNKPTIHSLVWFPHLDFSYYAHCGPVEFNISNSTKNKVMKTFQLSPIIFCRWADFAANVDPRSIYVNETVTLGTDPHPSN